jgi:diadenosine tetraphosphate (Ap4A) HIT family hydrolase
MSLYHIPAGRKPEQIAQMEDLEARGVCIFCPEHIKKEDASPIEIETEHWMVKKNSYPYKNTSHHLLLIPKEHVATIAKLSKSAQVEFLELVARCEAEYKLDSYGVFMRSGNMKFNGGSIEHLHAHIIRGNIEDPDHEVVRVKLSSK